MKNKLYCFLFSLLVVVPAAEIQSQLKRAASPTSLQQLPYFKTGTQVYQYSSTDPAEDQFNDYTHWLYSTSDSGAVLADIKGPGTIYRIWSTGNNGDSNRLRIYIDGSKTPAINETFNNFHDHPPLRDRPQVGSGGDKYLAWWSYMPIAFKDSIKIIRDGNFRPFYNITYHTYTENRTASAWSPKQDFSAMEQQWNHPDAAPVAAAGDQLHTTRVQLLPGQKKTVFNYTGRGYIKGLRINSYLADKNFILRMYWDGETIPSVEAPVKWFFGSVDNGGDLRALGIGTVNNRGYCYFPMPFWRNARIELSNLTDTTTRNMDVEVLYSTNSYPERDCGYFKTAAREAAAPGRHYTCLQTTGRGHVVGMAKRMPKGGHACEGDEIFYIDNRQFPDIYGTGEEDYANCAWWQNSYNSYPTHGCIGNDCYYRLHYPDLLVFDQGINMEFETWQHYYTASVVWYYAKDKPSLVLTDSLDVLDAASEKAHGFGRKGETWHGQKTGSYPGKRIDTTMITDGGRTIEQSCEFSIHVNPGNKGVRLRIRTDNTALQGVRVLVDGQRVKERPWVMLKNKYTAVWVDDDFEIPARYTHGKNKLHIQLEKLPGYSNWTAFRYQAYTYMY